MNAQQQPIAMAGGERRSGSSIRVDALELFVEVLSSAEEGAVGGDEFYARLCDAICRLARMRRALIFRYDRASRRVRAVGAHGIDLKHFAEAHVSVELAPITAQALREDRVIELSGDLRGHFPDEYAALFAEPARLLCVPMGAAGRAIGVILVDRPMTGRPFVEPERQLLWTMGKAVALAAVARIVARQRESAKQLEQRIDLARDVHEGVIQRLFGVSMALDGEGDLPAEARARCATETQAAIRELRHALQRPLGRAPQETGTTVVAEVERLSRANPALGLRLVVEDGAEVPPALEPLAQEVLIESVRNAQKHARPRSVEVRLGRVEGAFALEVVNDGVLEGRASAPAGIGLRLAAFAALGHGGVVEFGPREPGRWQVRLMVPMHD